MSENTKISLLVISCSLYKNIWNPLFYLLKKKWSDCPFDIYLGTDQYTESYKSEDCKVKLLKTQIEPYASNYTNRVVEFLKQINTKYVLLFQDDFLVNEQIHTDEIIDCLKILESNPQYNGIRLHGIGIDCGLGPHKYTTTRGTKINECSRDQKYVFSWMCSLWNTQFISDNLSQISSSADTCETILTNQLKKNGSKVLAIANERIGNTKTVKNIIPYLGIGAINGGIVGQKYIDFFKEKNIPIQVYDQNCIYDNRGNEHKFNKDDAYYMKCQINSGKRVEYDE